MLRKMGTSDKGLRSSAQARRGRETVKLKQRKRWQPTGCRSHLGIVKTHCGVGDETQWLKEHTARIEDPTLVSRAQLKCLTTARNSGSRESSTLLSLWAPVLTSGHTTDIQTHRHTHTPHIHTCINIFKRILVYKYYCSKRFIMKQVSEYLQEPCSWMSRKGRR